MSTVSLNCVRSNILVHDTDLYYATYELPHGVLYGMNGATLDECKELIGLLEEYKSTCQKLQVDCNADLYYYEMHFQGYLDYFPHQHLYKGYRDYIY